MTEKEKQTIIAKAKKCGLSVSEYVKQRALGYEPKAVLPDTLFLLLEKLGNLEDKSSSKKLNAEIENLLKEITNNLLMPGKEGVPGSPQSKLLCGEKEHPHIDEPFAACGESEERWRDATWQLPDSGPFTET